MKDLINQLLTQFAWFTAESGSEFSGSDAVEFAKKNNLVGTLLTDSEGTKYRINTSKYWVRNQERQALWINPVSKNEVEQGALASKYNIG